MTKVAIVYFVTDFNHSDHRHTAIACGDRTVYVRTEQIEVEDKDRFRGQIGDEDYYERSAAEVALDKANPGEHETFNTLEFDPTK